MNLIPPRGYDQGKQKESLSPGGGKGMIYGKIQTRLE
jgi:hypothetical protein